MGAAPLLVELELDAGGTTVAGGDDDGSDDAPGDDVDAPVEEVDVPGVVAPGAALEAEAAPPSPAAGERVNILAFSETDSVGDTPATASASPPAALMLKPSTTTNRGICLGSWRASRY